MEPLSCQLGNKRDKKSVIDNFSPNMKGEKGRSNPFSLIPLISASLGRDYREVTQETPRELCTMPLNTQPHPRNKNLEKA